MDTMEQLDFLDAFPVIIVFRDVNEWLVRLRRRWLHYVPKSQHYYEVVDKYKINLTIFRIVR
jgi:hypothetical protein